MKNGFRSKLTQFAAGVGNLLRGKPWSRPVNAPQGQEISGPPAVSPKHLEPSGRGIVKIHNLVLAARRSGPMSTTRDAYGNLYFVGDGGALYRHQQKVRGKRARQRERGRRKEARRAAAEAAHQSAGEPATRKPSPSQEGVAPAASSLPEVTIYSPRYSPAKAA